jgi:hypothetical protein
LNLSPQTPLAGRGSVLAQGAEIDIPLVARWTWMIADDVAKDTRKLDPTEAFTTGVYGDGTTPPGPSTLKGFADQRRAFLLAHPEIVKR